MVITRLLSSKIEKEQGGKKIFRMTDESIDRHRTVIKMDGWDFSAFRMSPTIFYQHLSYTDNPDHALGTGDLIVKSDAVYLSPNFEPEELNPLAAKLEKKIEFGTISMVSVGFNPIEWSFGNRANGEDPDILYFRKVELLEVSIVHIGSNRNAHNKMIDSETIGEFARMAREERDMAQLKESAMAEDVKESSDKTDEDVSASFDTFRIRFDKLRISTL